MYLRKDIDSNSSDVQHVFCIIHIHYCIYRDSEQVKSGCCVLAFSCSTTSTPKQDQNRRLCWATTVSIYWEHVQNSLLAFPLPLGNKLGKIMRIIVGKQFQYLEIPLGEYSISTWLYLFGKRCHHLRTHHCKTEVITVHLFVAFGAFPIPCVPMAMLYFAKAMAPDFLTEQADKNEAFFSQWWLIPHVLGTLVRFFHFWKQLHVHREPCQIEPDIWWNLLRMLGLKSQHLV